MTRKIFYILFSLFLFSVAEATLTEIDSGGGVHLFVYCNDSFEYINDFHILVDGVTITSIGTADAPPGPEWSGHFTPGGYNADWWTSMPPDGDPIFNGECDTFLIVVEPDDTPFGYHWSATQDGATVDSGSGTALAVNERHSGRTSENFLLAAYPNPFNSSVKITVNVGANGVRPTIEIYDLRGNVVESSRASAAGDAGVAPTNRAFIWTPDKTISSGIYLVRARTADGGMISKRIVLIK